MTICWYCFVFQELCEQIFPEIVNVESSNIISNDFVDHKPEKNETLISTAKKDNKSSTQSYNKFGGGIKLLEMYMISKLKLLILQLLCFLFAYDWFVLKTIQSFTFCTIILFILFYFYFMSIFILPTRWKA